MLDIKSWTDSDGVQHKGSVAGKLEEFEIIECTSCDFKHAIPLPKFEDLEEVYTDEYYSIEKPLYIERYLEDKEWWDLVYSARYDILEKNLAKESRKILDVGSGPGLFLLKGKERGWQVKGIEPSTQAATYSTDVLDLDIENSFLDTELASKIGSFSAINLGEVLEHLPEPFEMLKLVHSLLDDDGMICLIVPNDFNPFQLILRDHLDFKPWWVAPPHHINYFNFKSLTGLVERCGFEVVHKEATFPIDMFLLMRDNYIGDDIVGRECHKKRMNFEKSVSFGGDNSVLKNLYSSFAKQGIGREVVLFARKIKSI